MILKLVLIITIRSLNLCSDELPKSYVCVFLHVEPEAAVNPGGNLLLTQVETIRNLRHFLDKDISLVLKEHPSMFVQPSSKIVDSHLIYRSDFFFNLIEFCSTFLGCLLTTQINLFLKMHLDLFLWVALFVSKVI